MSIACFYVEPSLIQGNTLILSEETSKHVVQVLRKQIGEVIFITDGCGHKYQATLLNNHRKNCLVSLSQKTFVPKPTTQIRLAISLIKNSSRLEWFLEKATEIGVSEIILMLCDRTEKQQVKMPRLKNILISALLQSEQVWLPVMEEPIGFSKLLATDISEQKFIACCDERFSLKYLMQQAKAAKPTLVLIGPEGDFTKAELDAAVQKNFMPVSLGNNRLRTETAGVVAITQLQAINL